MANVNIPLSVSDGVKKIYLADYDKNIFKTKAEIVPKNKETEIGDVYELDFKPQIKIKRWNNNANLSVRIAGLPEEDAVVMTGGGKIKYTKGAVEARFYYVEKGTDPHLTGDIATEDAHEFDVVYYEKPASNKAALTIASKNLAFYKQPPLTEAEIASGDHERPENVVGSYAVYHKDFSGKTAIDSKAMHIYRPFVKDAAGRKEWCEINIEAEQEEQFGTMEITMPQEFLNTAVYPITLDPSFGYTTAGGSNRKSMQNTAVGNLFTAPGNGKMVSMHAYMGGGGVGKTAQAAVYYSNQDLFGYVTSPSDVTLAPAWVDFTSGAGPAAPDFAITANDDYYLVCNVNSPAIQFYYDVLTATAYEDPQSYGTWDDPGNFATAETRTYSVYAVYIYAEILSATTTLSASKSIKVKKLRQNSNIQLSVQGPGKHIDAKTTANIASAAESSRKNRRTKSVTEELLAAAPNKFYRRTKSVTITLSASVTKFIKKARENAVLTLSSLAGSRRELTGGASIVSAADNTKKTKKTKNVSFALSALVLKNKKIKRTHSASLSLGAEMSIRVFKTFSSNLTLTGLAAGEKTEGFNATFFLGASKTIRVSKDHQAVLLMLTAKDRFITAIANVTLNLAPDILAERAKKRTKNVTLQVTASKSIFIKKKDEAAVTASGDKVKKIKKNLSATLSLAADTILDTTKQHISNVTFAATASKSIFVTRGDGSTVTISGDKVKKIKKNLSAPISLGASISFLRRKTLSVTITLTPSVDFSAQQDYNGAVTVVLAPDAKKRIKKVHSAIIQLSAFQEGAESALLETSMTLGASMTVFVKKTFNVGLSMSATSDEGTSKLETLETSTSLASYLVKFIKKILFISSGGGTIVDSMDVQVHTSGSGDEYEIPGGDGREWMRLSARDSAGGIWAVVHCNDDSKSYVVYSSDGGTTWDSGYNFFTGFQGMTDIMVDQNDYVHVVYREYGTNLTKHVRRTSSWQAPVTIGANSTTSKTTMDANGNMYLFVKLSTTVINYYIYTNSTNSWAAQSNIAVTGVANSIDAYTDSNNYVHIIYNNGGVSYYRKWNGSSWDSEVNIGAIADKFAIMIDSNDNVLVVSGSGAFKYNYFNGSTWSGVQINSSVTDPDSLCLSIDASDNFHAAYIDSAAYQYLYTVSFNGSTWTSETELSSNTGDPSDGLWSSTSTCGRLSHQIPLSGLSVLYIKWIDTPFWQRPWYVSNATWGGGAGGGAIALGASMEVRITKSFESNIIISGDSSQTEGELLEVTIVLTEEKPAKFVGKTFTIPAHSQSDYHRCCRG